MDTYTVLRHFADSWMLLAMLLFFIGVILYTLRPGSRAVHDDIANIPLRNETLPTTEERGDTGSRETETSHG